MKLATEFSKGALYLNVCGIYVSVAIHECMQMNKYVCGPFGWDPKHSDCILVLEWGFPGPSDCSTLSTSPADLVDQRTLCKTI